MLKIHLDEMKNHVELCSVKFEDSDSSQYAVQVHEVLLMTSIRIVIKKHHVYIVYVNTRASFST